jgi:citrate lyase subunit beta/citryl-CoA lyase
MVNDNALKTFRAAVAPLFVPGDRPERFAKAVASGADAVVLDLEDAVAPDRKEAARRAIQTQCPTGLPVIVRINAAASPHFQADLAALKELPLAAVMLAKAEHAADIAAVRARLGANMAVIPLIESARGIANLAAILASDGVWVAAFGALDCALDLGCQPSWEALQLVRCELVLRSRLAGKLAPIDGVTTSLDDVALIEAEARRASDLGFGGKLAIHPKQVAAITRAFKPDEAAIAWANKVMQVATSGAAVQVDGAMVDLPLIERARRILA